MKIAVIGTGYVGLVTGTCLSDLGNEVACVDIDPAKVAKLESGVATIYEPGLDELLKKNIRKKRLSFTTDVSRAVRGAEVIFIAVGTPPDKEGKADLSAVRAVARNIGENLNGYKVIINKSTVPVGSGDMVRNIISENLGTKHPFDVVSNPEFLREGSAIEDFMHPDRIVIGADGRDSVQKIRQIYEPLEAPIVVTDIKSAEIIKYASNAFLAVKISFINEIANFCELVDASVESVSRGMGLDHRIGNQFLKAGIGYGGSCFPKDTQALYEKGRESGYEFRIVKAAIDVNEEKKDRFLEKVLKVLEKNGGKKVAVWGLAFKPNTDDMREAPSIPVIKGLLARGIGVSAYDPVSMDEARKIFGGSISYGQAEEIIKAADALVILTDWNEFKQVDFELIKASLKKPVIVDGRNIYNPQEMKDLGFKYYSVGRRDIV
jgi:UDPglucose 6-dehydrogenase